MAFQKKIVVKQGGNVNADQGQSDSGLKEKGVGYNGEILENDQDALDDDWLKTKFKCRKHMDVDAKLGGDGRNAMEDYEVIEGRNSDRKRHKHGFNGRRHKGK